MMKRLIPIALIVCMLFALVSCDFLFPEKNDPEKNTAHIVEALNSGSAIDEIFAPQNAADSTVTPEEMLSPESLVEIIKGIAIEGTVNTNLGGEAHSGYLGIKDGVIYVKEGENELTLTLVGNLRNMQGPFHLTLGESYNVTPGDFYKEPCLWFGGSAKERWTDDHCFAHISLSNRK